MKDIYTRNLLINMTCLKITGEDIQTIAVDLDDNSRCVDDRPLVVSKVQASAVANISI